jgi:hypothetical protein
MSNRVLLVNLVFCHWIYQLELLSLVDFVIRKGIS